MKLIVAPMIAASLTLMNPGFDRGIGVQTARRRRQGERRSGESQKKKN
ncbi:MAG: hypothetical protein ACREBD_01735 [Blastocatellia bacterium]